MTERPSQFELLRRLATITERDDATPFLRERAGLARWAVAEIERLNKDRAWLMKRLHDAVNTCYGGVTHRQVEACSFDETER